ncbi:MAG: flagellar filament capping protein FliD [Candidatus Thiodiazotropha sp. (ex Ustalcina ferruginea)]|nr:flagellar filament capping protein FliD [Candidatus Thiodiazotropha sp. (ex Ustalcina ferruginea)]
MDASNNTLAGLRDAVNNASDNPGVTATLLNETGGTRLILTSDASGLSRLFYIGAGGDGLAEQVSTAGDALLTIDGFDIESTSNSVTGAISGVTLELVAAGSASIGITRDNAKIEEKVTQFVYAQHGYELMR